MCSTTCNLLAELNKVNGKAYPDIGYSYFADVKGDGVYTPRIWTIINQGGGVTLSDLNDSDPKKRCNKIRHAIQTENKGL